MGKRVFLIVLDSLGIGEAPDAAAFGDEGSNTLGAIRKDPSFYCPNLEALGLFHITGVGGGVSTPRASFARMHEASAGKDTTIGHWERIRSRPRGCIRNGSSVMDGSMNRKLMA